MRGKERRERNGEEYEEDTEAVRTKVEGTGESEKSDERRKRMSEGKMGSQ